MLRGHATRTRLGIVLAVAAGVLLGAVFGQPGTGRAAGAAVPKNTQAPAISGTAEMGQTLTATRGRWTGNPTSFLFAWSRCDATGAAYLAIAGATGRIYTGVSTSRVARSGSRTRRRQAAAPCPSRRGVACLRGAGKELVDLGRAEAALRTSLPGHAHRLKHPGHERNRVREQREEERPRRERRRSRSGAGVLSCRRGEDHQREGETARHRPQPRVLPVEHVADRDEGGCRSRGNHQQAEPESERLESRRPGCESSRREHQGQEPRAEHT
jgi:hypothetical protein